jgi:hypothetical protein
MPKLRTLALVLAVGSQIACETLESTYPTRADAERDGAFARGWLPDLLPRGSRNIREIHDLDTNRVWCSFDFQPEDARALRAALDRVRPRNALFKVQSPGVRWWPPVLRGEIDLDAIARSGLDLRRDGATLWAIDWRQGRGCFYASQY